MTPPLTDTPTPGPATRRPGWLAPLLLVVALVVAGATVWALTRETLADRDPHGAAACDAAAQFLRPANAKLRLGFALTAGQEAHLATTEDIRSLARPPVVAGNWLVNMAELSEVCSRVDR